MAMDSSLPSSLDSAQSGSAEGTVALGQQLGTDKLRFTTVEGRGQQGDQVRSGTTPTELDFDFNILATCVADEMKYGAKRFLGALPGIKSGTTGHCFVTLDPLFV